MAKTKKTRRTVAKKKTASLARGPKFSRSSLLIFGLVFAGLGSYLLYQAFAATTIKAMSTESLAAEVSGMVASRKHSGVFWWHRDGGEATAEKPRDAIFAVKFDSSGNPQPVRGDNKFPFYMVSGSKNNNWEDIAIDDDNNIWIGDIGANNCSRNNQKFLKVKEPDPSSTATLAIEASYTFKFPDPASGCNTWNSEAMFWLDGKMYIFAKTKNSPVYRVDFPSGSSGTATLTKLGTLSGGVSNISVSSISDDRSRLMVASHGITRIYTTKNTSLKGDALVKDLIGRNPAFSAEFDCNCSTKSAVEGGSFRRGSYDVAYMSENKYMYYAKPAGYGDSASSTPSPTPTPSPSTDTTAPSVSIKSPTSGQKVSGTITIEVDASDNVGVTAVNIFYDGTNVIREGTSKGTYGWGSRFDTERIADGSHTIDVVAYDAAGNKKSVQTSFVVNNSTGDKTAPMAEITSPASGATVSGTITINVEASDDVGLSSVNIFYDDNGVIREGTSTGTFGWGSRFDTRKLSNGAHTIRVVAEDTSGNKVTDEISINVKN